MCILKRFHDGDHVAKDGFTWPRARGGSELASEMIATKDKRIEELEKKVEALNKCLDCDNANTPHDNSPCFECYKGTGKGHPAFTQDRPERKARMDLFEDAKKLSGYSLTMLEYIRINCGVINADKFKPVEKVAERIAELEG